jgi:SAM-dependent methyltransferase
MSDKSMANDTQREPKAFVGLRDFCYAHVTSKLHQAVAAVLFVLPSVNRAMAHINYKHCRSVGGFYWRLTGAVKKILFAIIGRRESATYAKQGFLLSRISENDASELRQLVLAAESTPILEEDHSANYRFTGLRGVGEQTLNDNITYVKLDRPALNRLETILRAISPEVKDQLGTNFRILNVRCWISDAKELSFGPNNWHLDGMPQSIHKVLLYLTPTSAQTGTTEMRLADGTVTSLEEPAGAWLLFKNSTIVHRGVSPKVGRRVMFEITLCTSFWNVLAAHDHGSNAVYPYLPSEISGLVRRLNIPRLTDMIYRKVYLPRRDRGGIPRIAPRYAINIGGGPGFAAWGWRNLEEVVGPLNPTSFKLTPDSVFPAKAGEIPLVYSSHCLEHLPDATVKRMLDEAYRVLTPSGHLILKIPDFDDVITRWRDQDHDYFKKWGLDGLSTMWAENGIQDTIDYRAAMVFCGYWNKAYADNHFAGTSQRGEGAYHGPPKMPLGDLQKLLGTAEPKRIVDTLRQFVEDNEQDIRFNHQNAWSKEDFRLLLEQAGFEVRTFDPSVAQRRGSDIPGIHAMKDISLYCVARKAMEPAQRNSA